MDTWSWGPNTFTAVATVITAVIAAVGFIYAILERRRDERPDVSCVSRDGAGAREGNPHWTLKIATMVRNPTRRTIQVVSVTLEKPRGAGFVNGDDIRREVQFDAPIAPLGERPHDFELRIPAAWKAGAIVLRFDIASPVGGKIVQERCQVRLGT